MAYDLVIEGGTIVDGTGRPPFRGDVAVQGYGIAAVGEVGGGAHRVIDGEGKYVGAGRFVQRGAGYDCTVVNGRVSMQDGEHTGELAGTVLRSGT